MVKGRLPGQTGAIFHFRLYPRISAGVGKGLKRAPRKRGRSDPRSRGRGFFFGGLVKKSWLDSPGEDPCLSSHAQLLKGMRLYAGRRSDARDVDGYRVTQLHSSVCMSCFQKL